MKSEISFRGNSKGKNSPSLISENREDNTVHIKYSIVDNQETRKKLSPSSFRFRLIVVVSVMLLMSIIVMTRDHIPQDESYHHFADDRLILSWIPNSFDVLSNIPFLLVSLLCFDERLKNNFHLFLFSQVGLHGIFVTLYSPKEVIENQFERINFLVFFFSIGKNDF